MSTTGERTITVWNMCAAIAAGGAYRYPPTETGVPIPTKLIAHILICFALHCSVHFPTQAQEPGGSSELSEPEKLVAREVYTQPGFSASRAREFAQWKARFIQDRRTLLETFKKIHHDHTLDEEERQTLSASARATAFANSIDKGKKGQSLVDYMIQAMHEPQSHVAHPGLTVARLVDSEHCQAVGFGGPFSSNGMTVELWYVVFHDMTTLRNDDLRTTAAFSVFSPLALPRLNEAKRNSWPSMTFVRDPQGRLMLWGMSEEQYRIAKRIEEKSMY